MLGVPFPGSHKKSSLPDILFGQEFVTTAETKRKDVTTGGFVQSFTFSFKSGLIDQCDEFYSRAKPPLPETTKLAYVEALRQACYDAEFAVDNDTPDPPLPNLHHRGKGVDIPCTAACTGCRCARCRFSSY
jgi:hypothetical protein